MQCLVLLFRWGYNWFPYYPVIWENIQNRWVCGLDELAGNSSGSYLYIKPTLDNLSRPTISFIEEATNLHSNWLENLTDLK